MISWNLDGCNPLELPLLLSHTSEHCLWDFACFQELRKFHAWKSESLDLDSSVSDSDDHHESNLTTSQSGQRPLTKVDVEPLVLDGYQLFENRSKLSAAAVVPYRWFPYICWSHSSEFACAVIVGLGDLVMIITAYLPQPGLGLDIYLRATAAVRDLARSSPRHLQVKRIFKGTDANCTLSHHEDVSHVVGNWNLSARSCAARSQAFLDLALELRLRAANTFTPEGQNSSEPCWTHRWNKNYTVKSQIDFVLCPIGVDTTVQLLYKLDCCSDHVAVHVEADMTLGRTAPIPRRARSLKGGDLSMIRLLLLLITLML